ncbi:MAG: hypothetical protein ABJP45_18415 [Cyclobacteriaceae bacterium]
MKNNLFRTLICMLIFLPSVLKAQESADLDLSLEEIMNRNVVDMSIEDWVDLESQEINKLSFYGFLNFNAEKVFNEPSIDGSGNTVYESGAFEMGNPSFHIYGGSRLSEKFSVFFNLGKNDDDIQLVNAWGNWKVHDMFQIRAGRQYRRFGLFNERLDQVPTYAGIEPPELFDGDHLLLPRTSLFSIHGEKKMGTKTLKYLLTTSNGESGPETDVLPLGWDLRYATSFLMVGMSGYTSNIGSAKSQSTVGVGDGSPKAGILPWMSGDKYSVFGIFAETRKGNFSVKAAYFKASHDADRNPDDVFALFTNGQLNASQTGRMFNTATPTSAADVDVNGDYDVNTWYLRFSYDINTTKGKFTPYFFLDHYENKENIGSKDFGGDNEAGVADDGEFLKPSLGVVFRPIEKVAIKLDGSSHYYNFNGKKDSYPEVRIDISYMFK